MARPTFGLGFRRAPSPPSLASITICRLLVAIEGFFTSRDLSFPSGRAHQRLFDSTYILMAHRIVTQVVLVGSRVLGRAFAEAYRQAAASSQYARQNANAGPGAARNVASSGLTLDEACRILNVKPPQGGKANMEHVMERFKKMFDANDVKNGGSFYLQSKILRARERIEFEVGEAADSTAREAELKDGWNPKLFRNR